jgi:uncharacterized protein (DUF1697 family)
LLRGVNHGKQRKLPMAALRDSLVATGLSDVRTYLVRTTIAANFSLDVPVITRRPAEIDGPIAANPFASCVALGRT